MKAIRKRLLLLASMLSMGVLSSIWLLTWELSVLKDNISASALMFLAVSFILLLTIREYEIYGVARLIMENRIMHIPVAEIKKEAVKAPAAASLTDDVEVFISCFGILLGSRIIKFNIEGIELRAVDIGYDFIHLICGTDEKLQHIKLLHGEIDAQELADIVERFRYETGIVPGIVKKSHLAL